MSHKTYGVPDTEEMILRQSLKMWHLHSYFSKIIQAGLETELNRTLYL